MMKLTLSTVCWAMLFLSFSRLKEHRRCSQNIRTKRSHNFRLLPFCSRFAFLRAEYMRLTNTWNSNRFRLAKKICFDTYILWKSGSKWCRLAQKTGFDTYSDTIYEFSLTAKENEIIYHQYWRLCATMKMNTCCTHRVLGKSNLISNMSQMTMCFAMCWVLLELRTASKITMWISIIRARKLSQNKSSVAHSSKKRKHT